MPKISIWFCLDSGLKEESVDYQWWSYYFETNGGCASNCKNGINLSYP